MKNSLAKSLALAAAMALSLGASAQQSASSETVETFTPITTGVSFLTVAPDARGGGLGDVGAATSPDGDSQYWNASKFAFIDGVGGANVSYVPWLRKLVSDIDLITASGFYKIKDVQTVAMSFRFFSLGQVLIRKDQSDPGYNVKPYDLALDASYSRILTKNFSMGVTARFVYSDLTGGQSQEGDYIEPGWALAADISGFYGKEVDFAWGQGFGAFGFNISNLGNKVQYGDYRSAAFLPANLRIGGSFKMPFDKFNHLTLSIDLNRLMVPLRPSTSTVKQNEGETNEEYTARISTLLDEYYRMGSMAGIGRSFVDNPDGFVGELKETNFAIGLEYDYNNQFFGRIGYHNESKQLGNRKYVTFGAGFRLNVFSLDVAYVLSVAANNPLDQTLRFTLGFNMGGLKRLSKNEVESTSAEDANAVF